MDKKDKELDTDVLDDAETTNEEVIATKEETEVEQKYEEVETQKYEEVSIQKSKKKESSSYFDGKVIELIGYKILRVLIIIFTLTIAKPWADCLLLSYKINHTVLNGERLKFEGTGSSLFVQKFKWTFLTIITLGIYAWIVPIRKLQWVMSKIRFEGKELITGESVFEGKLIALIGINILCSIINLLTLGLGFAITDYIKYKWIAKHTIISKRRIVFNGNSLILFVKYITWGLLTIITFGIFGLWLDIVKAKWYVKNSHIKLVDEKYEKQKINPVIVIVIVALGIFGWIILGNTIKGILFEEPVNKEQEIIEINNAITPAFAEISQIVNPYDNVDDTYEGNIEELNSLRTLYDDGARGTYWYNKYQIHNRNTADYTMVVDIIYNRYLCYKEVSENEELQFWCDYLNLDNIIEKPELIGDFFEARFPGFYW